MQINARRNKIGELKVQRLVLDSCLNVAFCRVVPNLHREKISVKTSRFVAGDEILVRGLALEQ